MLTLPLLLWTFRRFGLLERKTVLTISPWSPALWGTWCSWSWTLLPPLRCTWEHFIMFVNTVLHLSFSLLVYSSMLQMYLLCMVPFMYVRYYFFVLFVMAKISFIQLWVHISKTDPLMSCLRLSSLCASSYHSTPVHLCDAPCVSASQTLCHCTRHLFLCPTSLCQSLEHLIWHSITTRYCQLYKTMVVPRKVKQK